MDLKGRIYADFAKMRARIAKMPDGKKKAKATILCSVITELCMSNNPHNGTRQLDYEDQTGVYHKP